MVTLDTKPISATATLDRSSASGIFYLEDVLAYAHTTDASVWGRESVLTASRLGDWGKRGYFDTKRDERDRYRRYISFAELITARMIAMLRSFGIQWKQIRSAHDYILKATGEAHPFATKTFWTDDSDHPTHLYTTVDDILVSADLSGQRLFRTLRKTKLVATGQLEFSQGRAATWEPHPDVLIDPRVQGGVPCVKDRRIPTSVLHAMHRSGDSIQILADDFETSTGLVEAAIAWEERLAQHSTETKR